MEAFLILEPAAAPKLRETHSGLDTLVVAALDTMVVAAFDAGEDEPGRRGVGTRASSAALRSAACRLRSACAPPVAGAAPLDKMCTNCAARSCGDMAPPPCVPLLVASGDLNFCKD